jgi:ATP-dependent DNA ligase
MAAPAFDALGPMLLGKVKKPFSDPAWAYELKYDGYRLLLLALA